MLRFAILAAVITAATGVAAQGIKETARSGASSMSNRAAASPSRPTAITNVPTQALPPGRAIQRTYRDGKLQPYLR
jgi:hypothetical protein